MWPDKLSLTRKVRKLKCCGHQQPMMKWQWWFMVTHLYGRCMRILGILFQESCQSESILIWICKYLTPGSNMNATHVFTILWLMIRCTSLKMPGHSPHPRTHMPTATNGDHKRTLSKRKKCVTLTGTQKAHTQIFTIERTSRGQTRPRYLERIAAAGDRRLYFTNS